ncbi:MAG: twin-arginine translocase TatA/TatE family subunit [Solirubrobacterales bacterium]|nr:twin-arginine translocase TatA/TatE family subunit [Solirubrobacterales bacterium]
MAGIGPLELAIVLVIVLVVFGPKRLPSLGKQLGSGMREFKDSITGKTREEEEEERRATLAASEARPVPEARPAVEVQPVGEPRDDASAQPRA